MEGNARTQTKSPRRCNGGSRQNFRATRLGMGSALFLPHRSNGASPREASRETWSPPVETGRKLSGPALGVTAGPEPFSDKRAGLPAFRVQSGASTLQSITNRGFLRTRSQHTPLGIAEYSPACLHGNFACPHSGCRGRRPRPRSPKPPRPPPPRPPAPLQAPRFRDIFQLQIDSIF